MYSKFTRLLSIFVLLSVSFVMTANAEKVFVSPHDCPYIRDETAVLHGPILEVHDNNLKISIAGCNIIKGNHGLFTVHQRSDPDGYLWYIDCIYRGKLIDGEYTTYLHTNCQNVATPKTEDVRIIPPNCPKRFFYGYFNHINNTLIMTMPNKPLKQGQCKVRLKPGSQETGEFTLLHPSKYRYEKRIGEKKICRYLGYYLSPHDTVMIHIFKCNPPLTVPATPKVTMPRR